MNPASDQMSDGLVRQRRNLVLVCLVIAFARYAEVKITKLGILGIQFGEFSNPEAVYMALWVGLFYFLIRYYQYFYQEGLINLTTQFKMELDKRCASKIKSIVKKRHPDSISGDFSLQRLKKWGWRYHGKKMDYSVAADEKGGETLVDYSIKFSLSMFWKEIALSLMITCLNSSAVTDYILPFILAIAITVYGYSGWEGGIYELGHGVNA